jgi:hypothetical protein
MPQREVIQSPNGQLRFEFNWLDSPAERFGPTYGDLIVRLGTHSAWTAPSDANHGEGVTGLWIGLLEHLSSYWLYLVLEQGYPFNVSPQRPSQLDDALAARWENASDAQQTKEEEEAYAYKLSHNLAEAFPGILRPDLWFVRDGGVFTIEAQTGAHPAVERVSSDEVKQVLVSVGDAINKRLDTATDVRSLQARAAWLNRERADLATQVRIATGLPTEYLEQTRGLQRYDEIFSDPESSWAGDNVCLDVAYRCKGVMPPDHLRALLDQTRAVRIPVSSELEFISDEAIGQLAGVETSLSRPYQQGLALARWLRARTVGRDGRVEPEQLLASWHVTVDGVDFSARSLDAVAFWAHGHNPTVLWNRSDKHVNNAGARRATLSHEICHLLIDRSETLPLAAVVGGAMERRLEQRANAFAAEFLCPRNEAFTEYQRSHTVRATIDELTTRFGVSNGLAALQLARSGQSFNLDAQREIENLGPQGAHYPWSS